MKIYTKTGDDGTTGLFAGDRVGKDHPRISAYGTVDELNSFLGLALLQVDFEKSPRLIAIINRLQNELFVLGGDLATPGVTSYKVPRIEESHIISLEKDIDDLQVGLEPLKQFILPGGSHLASYLHLARTVCRRAEREVVSLARVEKIDTKPSIYLNRLSDLLFVMSRVANADQGVADVAWYSE